MHTQQIPNLKTDIWVTGPIHGKLSSLKAIYDAVCQFNPEWPVLLLNGNFLGDLEESNACIEFIRNNPGIFPCLGLFELDCLDANEFPEIGKGNQNWIRELPTSFEFTTGGRDVVVLPVTKETMLLRKGVKPIASSENEGRLVITEEAVRANEKAIPSGVLYNITQDTMFEVVR